MSNYRKVSSDTNVHFSNAMFGQVERSRMTATPIHATTFNAGDIVPIYCREVLPTEQLSIDLDFVIRQTTIQVPTMGTMKVDFYAFFVPNRIVNQSWKAVQGENYSGSWTANSVSLAPLVSPSAANFIEIPVGSVADYYGFPTQLPIANSVLSKCNDLKFRGYVMIYNEWFRDQNYQPPIPMSTLNVYQGFLDSPSQSNLGNVPLDGDYSRGDFFTSVVPQTVPDGNFGPGAVAHSLYGSATIRGSDVTEIAPIGSNLFKAYNKPLKANKLHDYFTSCLPSPQKSNSPIFVPVSGQISSRIPVTTSAIDVSASGIPLRVRSSLAGADGGVVGFSGAASPSIPKDLDLFASGVPSGEASSFEPSNLSTVSGAEVSGLEVSLDDIRMSSAIQQVYETLARGGSRYRELVQSFFGVAVDDPYSDIPVCLGHVSRDLDLYQTAQTSASQTGGSAQGNLAAFGYTASGGHLFDRTFIEHGYVHIFAIVRHRNIYSTYLAKDNFRMNMLDFYTPPLANISEQPIFLREINPFAGPDADNAIGYQEAWSEYRYEPDYVTGLMRPGAGSADLSVWNYADDLNSGFRVVTGEWLKSNSEAVLNRTLTVRSDGDNPEPQLRGIFKFIVDKELPMPTYSVPGMDII